MTSSYDVIIVGGGAIGAACARELARERRRVLVLDRPETEGAAWRAAAGMLAPQIESERNESLYELGVASRDR
ncbi:MAG TPA: FAD-dependent oxidoreductase, partial [Gemmatimonadales bacterium]